MPNYYDEENETIRGWETFLQRKQLIWGTVAILYTAFALKQFMKIYYPYGVIIRSSIPVSTTKYILQRAPMGLFFVATWYFVREYPRKLRVDLSSPNEA
mmetsp:Transcript_8961/g.6726  ORF Transcript_8961/g.6726 Transcript_8961/m.6726 type:complete len:99 (+) Transcript_8961:138-434(+)